MDIVGTSHGGVSSLVRVMGGFVGHANTYWTDLKLLTDNVYEKTDAININFYFGHDIGSAGNPVASVNDVFQKIPATKAGLYGDMDNLRNLLANDSRYSHIKIVSYEGGQHLAQSQGGGPHQILIDANRDTRMGTEYTDMLNNWKQRGGTLFCNFSSTSTPSRYGSWGVLERQTGNATYQRIKYDAIINWMNANPRWWTIKGGATSRVNTSAAVTERTLEVGEEKTGEFGAGLFPNPARNLIKVVLNNQYEGPVEVLVIDSEGYQLSGHRKLKSSRVLEFEVNTAGFGAGLYFVKMQADKLYVTKFIKK